MTKVVKSTGGRSRAGFGYEDNDCTVITTQHAFGYTYAEAHKLLELLGRKDGEGFCLDDHLDTCLKRKIRIQGKYVLSCTKTYGKGYRVKQFVEEHPQGVWILHVREHIFCVKNGKVYDSNNGRPFYNNYSIMYFYEIGKK